MMGEAPPPDLVTEGMLPPQPVFRGQAKGRSLVHGLPVQIAYATIDAVFVLISGVSIFWLRFGVGHPFGAQYGLFASSFGRTHLNFFLLDSALVVLCCMSQGLYSTPRDRGFMTETVMVGQSRGRGNSTPGVLPFLLLETKICRESLSTGRAQSVF